MNEQPGSCSTPVVTDEGCESLEPGVLCVTPSNLDHSIERDTRLICNSFPVGRISGLEPLDYKSKIIHKRTMDHLRSECKPFNQIRAKKAAPISTVSKRKPDRHIETGEFAGHTLKDVLAANFKKLIARDFPDLNDEQLAAKTGLSKGTIGRVRRADTAATISTLEEIAAVFKLEPYQLLIPIQDSKNIQSIRNTRSNPVDSDLAAAWPFLSAETKNRFISEAGKELIGGKKGLDDVLQRLKNRLHLETK